jgi:hypothetical protein
MPLEAVTVEFPQLRRLLRAGRARGLDIDIPEDVVGDLRRLGDKLLADALIPFVKKAATAPPQAKAIIYTCVCGHGPFVLGSHGRSDR